MASKPERVTAVGVDHGHLVKEQPAVIQEKDEIVAVHENCVKRIQDVDDNLVYDNDNEVPDMHLRTYIAVAAMFLLNFVQVVALQGPPTVLSYIGTELNNPDAQTWVPNSLSLVQAVVGPVIASASDVFQARKVLLVGASTISVVGSAIAPGSKDIYRLIAAQSLIGVGFASVPLAYVVPGEIMPRKWRPLVLALMNVAAAAGAILGPLVIGALTKKDASSGWRNFYWMQTGLWAASSLGILLGYRPPNRHTKLDHLSLFQKLGHLDLAGCTFLTIGLALFLTGLNLGGGLYSWTNARTLSTLIIGITFLIAFSLYEWKGTKTGFLHHDLFRGPLSRVFTTCIALIFIEGVMVFTFIVFFPIVIVYLFETDPLLIAARLVPFWAGCLLSTVVWGWWSSRFRTIREPMVTGFIFFTVGLVGLATIQPDSSTNSIVFSAIAGIGFGAPLILVITGVQLSTPHGLIATATAVVTSTRAVAASLSTAIYAAAFGTRAKTKIPSYIAAAAAQAGLPPSSIPAFIGAVAGNTPDTLSKIPGITPAIIAAGVSALKAAFADSIRVVYIIGAPFGIVACLLCYFLGGLRETMNYHVDAPVEDLKAKHRAGDV